MENPTKMDETPLFSETSILGMVIPPLMGILIMGIQTYDTWRESFFEHTTHGRWLIHMLCFPFFWRGPIKHWALFPFQHGQLLTPCYCRGPEAMYPPVRDFNRDG